MAKTVKLKNDIYVDSDCIKGKAISQNDFLELNNGFSILQYNVTKIGNNITGTIVLSSEIAFGNYNALPFKVKSQYVPRTSHYNFCGFGTRSWAIQGIGYIYFGRNGDTVICDHNDLKTYKYAIISLNYQTE